MTIAQAGGGVDVSDKPVHITSPSIIRHVDVLASSWTSSTRRRNTSTFQDLLEHLSSAAGSAQVPPLHNDLSLSFPNYFISSSHNTYLTGNQLSSDASAEGYRNVLLRGCRSVEIDVWDGSDSDDEHHSAKHGSDHSHGLLQGIHEKLSHLKHGHRDSHQAPTHAAAEAPPQAEKPLQRSDTKLLNRREPRVLHGHTLTKEVPFRRVCEAIRDSAFVTSDLPVVISLEIHTSLEQQHVMVEIMEQTWRGYLIDQDAAEADAAVKHSLPSPSDLRRKILIKVKYTPPEAAKKKKIQDAKDAESSKATSDSDSDDEDQASTSSSKKKKKMIDSLSGLGVYTRAYKFKGFNRPEAKIPTHVFSLSEKTLLETSPSLAPAVFSHNRNYMMRAYPKALRLTSTNLNPPLFWRQGVQMAALNWQDCDKGIMLNEGMFAGTGGFMLKPASYRSYPIGEQAGASEAAKIMNIAIEVFAAQDLSLPHGRSEREFRPMVKCSLHVEDGDGDAVLQPKLKVHTEASSGRNASWSSKAGHGAHLVYRNVLVDEEELCFLRLKIMDDVALGKDNLAAWACIRLDRLRPGLAIVRLWDAKGRGDGGLLLVRISKEVKGDKAEKSSALPVSE